MNYIGLKKPKDRAALIAWLRSLSDKQVRLPTAAEIEAELPKEVEEAVEAVKDAVPAAH